MDNPTPRIIRIPSVIRLLIAIGLTALCQTSVALAVTPATKPAAKPAAPTARPTVNASVVLPQLEQAYNFLATAEGNYQGHRVLAMREIADTAQLLGRRLTPPANPQKQPLSDLQIRSVQMVLLDIGRSVPPGDNNAPVVVHLNAAISELAQGMDALHPQRGANRGNGSAPGAGSDPAARRPPPGRGQLIVDNPINTNMVEVGALEDIYETLSVANHDYKGHRVRSMNAIARVIRALGANIRGDGRGHEEQIVSDQQLHYAQFLLEQVCKSFSTNDPKAILKDLTTAYNELTTALSIK